MAPTVLQEAPMTLQDGSKWPKSSPRTPRRGKHPSKRINVLGVRASSLPMAIRGFKMTPRWPKRASRALPRFPTALQEGPKRRPGGPRGSQ
eukprot:5770471-Pyramimonas_sp.AAC.1